MVIKIELREPWTLHQEKLTLPLDANNCISYENQLPSVTGQFLLEEIGVPKKEICFVRINGGSTMLSRDFVKMDIKDGDFVAIFPFSIAG
ncbi:MAG: hypothetical protein ACOX05_04360 [Bacillota bacterium]|jgi:hypothetical protein